MKEQLRHELGLRQSTQLTPQQVQFVRLLEMNAPEIEEAAHRELDANPALAEVENPEDEPIANLSFPRHSRSEVQQEMRENMFSRHSAAESLYDVLNRQLGHLSLSGIEREAAQYIIGSLDHDGYFRAPLQNVANELAFNHDIEISAAQLEKAFQAVRSLEPRGVGATNLQDCLILQLEAMPENKRRNLALTIVKDYFSQLSLGHIKAISSAAKMTMQQTESALTLIRSLDPRPGIAFPSSGINETANTLIPDFIIEKNDGIITVTLNNDLPELTISKSFEQADKELKKTSDERKREDKSNRIFISSRLSDARIFIENLKRRQSTLFEVMTAIVRLQHDYFESEDPRDLRPMTLREIADATAFDISTVSRATANKSAALPWGIFPLRYFFSERFSSQNGSEEATEVSARRIESEIKRLIDNEDPRHPLSDDAIAKTLREAGYDVSRRTINKYRDRLGINVSRLRKKI